MARLGRVLPIIIMLLVMLPICAGHGEAAKAKSTVLVVFNNQSGRDKEEKLDEITRQYLHRKVDGLYQVLDESCYGKSLAQGSNYDKDIAQLLDEAGEIPGDYLVYVELLPFKQAEGFNVIWHRKKMTATMGLRIADLRTGQEIFKDKYTGVREDETDYFFVGSQSMARKSLKGVLFTVGEAISVHLPL